MADHQFLPIGGGAARGRHTDILTRKAKPLKEGGWTWESEKETLENPWEWGVLCDTVDAKGPNWEKYARVVGTILCAGKLQHPFRNTAELLILNDAFIVLFTYLSYYFPPQSPVDHNIFKPADSIRLRIKKGCFPFGIIYNELMGVSGIPGERFSGCAASNVPQPAAVRAVAVPVAATPLAPMEKFASYDAVA